MTTMTFPQRAKKKKSPKLISIKNGMFLVVCTALISFGFDSGKGNVMEKMVAGTGGVTTMQQQTMDKEFARRPRIMVAGPCAGSTATMDFVLKIMEAHGVKPHPMEYETLKPEKNWAWGVAYSDLEKQNKSTAFEDVIVRALEEMKKEADKKNEALIFKGDFSSMYPNYKLLFGLKNMGAVFSTLYRENPLDSCICGVRDCFDQFTPYGWPVFAANGSKADLCFGRRSHKTPTKIFMKDAAGCMAMMHGEQAVLRGFFEPISSPGVSTSYEALFEFEYTSDVGALHRSVVAWMGFMGAFLGSAMDKKRIEGVLRSYMNSRRAPPPQSENVINFDRVLSQIRLHDANLKDEGITDRFMEGFLRLSNETAST